jgi:beta-N-acetylhexosaminidase
MPVKMPEGIAFEYVMGVSVDSAGRIQLDSDDTLRGGVSPSLRVPRNAATMLAFAKGEDVELAYARQWLASEAATTGGSTKIRPEAIPSLGSDFSLEQKIGQMVVMGFVGTAPGDPVVEEARRQIAAGRLGGVVLYAYNVVSPDQVRTLSAAFASANPLDIALPIMVDQEGGLVQRLNAAKGFFSTPSAENVATTYSSEGAYLLYRSMAAMLRKAGFTWNFGPVVDLRGDPDATVAVDAPRPPASAVIGALGRSYAEDPAIVVDYASAFIRAHRDEGIVTSLKHFPGHGLAAADSHMGLVDITATALPVERLPFRSLIQAGLADSIMTAHLVHRGIDPDNPLTLSPGYMDRELRDIEAYAGFIVTDDLDMGAIKKYYSFEDSVIKAIRAGDDLLIFSGNPSSVRNIPGYIPHYHVAERVIRVVKEAIAAGIRSEARIEASWRRIQALRSKVIP